MSEEVDNRDALMVKFDEEIVKKVKKIITKEAEMGGLDELLDYDYWANETLEVSVPVIFKKSGKEGKINREYFVEINININDRG
jgi:hypothetical protein